MIRYAIGATLVRSADEGARVALALLALDRLGNAGLGGLLIAALLVPHVLAAPAVGLLVDRSGRPARLIGGAAAVFAGALIAAGLAVGRLPTGLVLAALLAVGCCGPVLTGGLSSRLGGLVSADRLPRAFGLESMSYNVAGIAGPAAAAVLAGLASPGAATVTLGAAALAGAALLATLPLAGSAARSPALAGVRVVLRQPVLATLTLTTSLGALAGGMLPVVVAVAATRAGSPAAAGLLLTALAVGALVGSALWTRWPAAPERAPWWVAGGLAGTGLPVLAGALHPTLPLLAVLFTIAGIADGPLFGALLTARQHWSPPELRGQVFTLGAGAKITAAAAGAALAGALAGAATAGQLAVAGAIPLLGAALAVAGFARGSRAPAPQRA
ncbi:MAG TPA: hypothetical protein VLM05_06980 [Mycobacteriales bacterium]|nr:hypothetical protein [Mycobacteriales bacterium]